MDFTKIEAKIKKCVLWLQALPEGYKKAILWAIVALIGIPMLVFWVRGTLKKIENIESIDIGLPQIETIEEAQPIENLEQQQSGNPEETQNQTNAEINNQQ